MMINRKNKKMIDEYLDVRREFVSPLSISAAENHLRILLEFADHISFLDLPKQPKSFLQYIKSLEARKDGKPTRLSQEYSRKAISEAKHFFEWLRDEKGCTAVTARFLNGFKIGKESRDDEDQKWYSLDEVVQIANMRCQTALEQRTQASALFLFLSGMRISAFTTMPIKAVDFESRTVKQWPSLGVHTKLGFKATTKLLEIPSLLEVVRKWDEKVRSTLPPDGLWFAPLSPVTGEIDPTAKAGSYRSRGFGHDLESLLSKSSIEFKSSHKFRHGHIRFLKNQAKDIHDLEAIAKNAMQTMSTMLNYGKMSKSEAHVTIDALCSRTSTQVQIAQDGKPDQATVAWVLNSLLKEQEIL